MSMAARVVLKDGFRWWPWVMWSRVGVQCCDFALVLSVRGKRQYLNIVKQKMVHLILVYLI